jgi:hypothetical protein
MPGAIRKSGQSGPFFVGARGLVGGLAEASSLRGPDLLNEEVIGIE